MTDQQAVTSTAFASIGFGFAIVLLALYFAEILDTNGLSVVLSTALFAGGLTSLIAGLWSLRIGNSFAAAANILGAIFWFSYVSIHFLPALGLTSPVVEPALAMWVQVPYFFLWGLLSFWLFLSSMKTNRVLQVFIFLVAIFFWLTAFGHWYAWDSWNSTGLTNTIVNVFAGWEGLVCGFIGIYYGIAQVLNDAFQREIMPLWKIERK